MLRKLERKEMIYLAFLLHPEHERQRAESLFSKK
jgi:hypothetical protein